MDEVRRSFRPEFLNRVDDVIIFNPLSLNEIRDIVRLVVDQLRSRLLLQGIDLEISEDALNQVAEAGFDPVYGARPLKRYVQRVLEGLQVYRQRLTDLTIELQLTKDLNRGSRS